MNFYQLLKLIPKKIKFIKCHQRQISPEKIEILAENLVKRLKKRKLFLAIMESCTGGGLANTITNVVGASDVFKGGFVTYSNQEKIRRGVPKKIIDKYSVYSPEVAVSMAYRAIKEIKGTDIGIGITGTLSRQDPKNPKSIIGQVYLAVVFKNKFLVRCFLLPNLKRSIVKLIIIQQALNLINKIINYGQHLVHL
ncbi:MAG: CinA family protein [Patescibacteria group bacterium]